MKNEEVENMLNNLHMPEPENFVQPELKIPVMSYRKSSRAGLWLLLLPLTVIGTAWLKAAFGVQSGYLDLVRKFFAAIDNNAVLTYLIPVIFVGLPLLSLVLNLLSICHFQQDRRKKELIITIKLRLLNIVLFLVSLAVVVFFLLPDKLSF